MYGKSAGLVLLAFISVGALACQPTVTQGSQPLYEATTAAGVATIAASISTSVATPKPTPWAQLPTPTALPTPAPTPTVLPPTPPPPAGEMTVVRGSEYNGLNHYILLPDARDFRVSFDVEVPKTIHPTCWEQEGSWWSARTCKDTDGLGRVAYSYDSYDAFPVISYPCRIRGGGCGSTARSPGRVGLVFRSEDGSPFGPASYIGPPSGVFYPRPSTSLPPFPFDRGQYNSRVKDHPWDSKPVCYVSLGAKPSAWYGGYQPPIPVDDWACYVLFYWHSGKPRGYTLEWAIPERHKDGLIREWFTQQPIRSEAGQLNRYELTVRGGLATFKLNGETTTLQLGQRSSDARGLWLVADVQHDSLNIRNLEVVNLD